MLLALIMPLTGPTGAVAVIRARMVVLGTVPSQLRPPRSDNLIDRHYYNLRQEMRRLFRTLKIAA
jgi:hypothetical protein